MRQASPSTDESDVTSTTNVHKVRVTKVQSTHPSSSVRMKSTTRRLQASTSKYDSSSDDETSSGDDLNEPNKKAPSHSKASCSLLKLRDNFQPQTMTSKCTTPTDEEIIVRQRKGVKRTARQASPSTDESSEDDDDPCALPTISDPHRRPYSLLKSQMLSTTKKLISNVAHYFTKRVNIQRASAAVSKNTFHKVKERLSCKYITYRSSKAFNNRVGSICKGRTCNVAIVVMISICL